MYNKVILVGYLTRDTELKYLSTGIIVGNFGIATNRKYGEDKEERFFGDVTVWGKMAEVCHEYIFKGSKVLIDGRLITDQFESHGERKQRTRIIAEKVRFLGKKRESADSDDMTPPEEITEKEPF